MAAADKSGFRPYLGSTALISLGFFTMGLMDPLYDNFVPLFLKRFIPAMSLRNSIMTIDNVFALFLIPIVAVWSDKARTRIGRRMPFILVTLPLSALLFAALPYAAAASLAALLALIVALNVFKQGARGPVVALMPDIIPGEFRSEANGVINMAGAAAGIIATLALGPLMGLRLDLPLLGSTTGRLPFILAALLVVISVILLFAVVKERTSSDQSAEERVPIMASLRAIAGSRDKSALLILVSIFLWFFAYQGVLPCLSTYMLDVIGVSIGQTSFAMGAAAVAMILFAVPAGYLAVKVGRRRVIRAALLGLVLVLAAIFAHEPATRALGLSGPARLYSFLFLMFLFGAFWIAVVANSFPMLWQMASFGNIGVYTAAYYVAKESSSIVSPPITGAISDAAGIRWIFAAAAAFMLAAFVVMGFVTRGESGERAEG
jgi:maltose/moltooligosaccharide transporter